jgi:two-component system cell cycle sensor histidine kinase/response regulator CckA
LSKQESGSRVSETDQLPAAIVSSEQKYRLLVEQLNVGVLMTSIDGRVLHGNAAAIQMAGYSTLSEFLAVPIQRLYADERERGRLLEVLLRDGQVRGFETVCIRKDGSHYPVWLGAILLLDEAGAPEYVLGTHEDISYRKHAERELQLLKNSIDTAPTGAYWFDSTGHLVYVNDAGCRALGYEREELLAQHVSVINPRATAERWSEVWRSLKERTTLALESEHRRKDGSRFAVELSFTYIVSGGNEYCNGYANDITERQRSEKQRETLQAQLLQSQKLESVGRLAGGVAHDFNNMLTVILGHVELSLSDVDPESSLSGDLLEIRGAAQRAADLTGQLLAFARRQTTAPKVLNLGESVVSMLKMLGRLIGEQIDLRFFAEGLWPVKIDPVQLYQILSNLCINARDAINGVGTIAIEAQNVSLVVPSTEGRFSIAPGEYVRLTVRDDGCGISEADMPHLFEPFFTTKDPGRGTGLGLATVYGIVTQNGGSIDVQSQLGAGTTYSVHLPRHIGELEAPQERHSVLIEGGGETVLLVEDELTILRVARNILERLGYQVLATASPMEAIRIAEDRARRIDLLISDVVMPEMN